MESAALLKKELDLLNLHDPENPTSAMDTTPETRDGPDTSALKDELECSTQSDDVIAVDDNNWTLLDCDFGVPLFNARINKNVCDKILQNSLCTKDRYT